MMMFKFARRAFVTGRITEFLDKIVVSYEIPQFSHGTSERGDSGRYIIKRATAKLYVQCYY